MVSCSLRWPYHSLCRGLISLFLAVIDPNSFGLVYMKGTFDFPSDDMFLLVFSFGRSAASLNLAHRKGHK